MMGTTRRVAVIGCNQSCDQCTATCDRAINVMYDNSDTSITATNIAFAGYYRPYVLTGVLDEMTPLEKYEQSRDWQPAPAAIRPAITIFGKRFLFNRCIAPRFWTGKNFKKVR
ncbi:MAG: hypothetical protein PHI12_11355 [Dehalococcoidales bacterium]|nr:hypothetical protein [Dehalococcoidales bacterium]